MCSEPGAPSGHGGSRRRRHVGTLCLGTVLLAGAGASTSGAADDTRGTNATAVTANGTLAASPGTCVALHKGQTCFRRVSLSWELPDSDERHCLEREGAPEPLLCWHGGGRGVHRHDYASANVERYTLVRVDTDAPLAVATVRTAWVHRASRRGAGGWRLF